jgi:curved DNA-binding protein CbpA
MDPNYYDILGVSKTASEEEIKTAFKNLAKKYHPDKHLGNSLYEEHFKKINTAYQILSDKEKRQRYDWKLEYANQKKNIKPDQGKYQRQTRQTTKPAQPKKTEEQIKKQRKYIILISSFLFVFLSGCLIFYYYMNNRLSREHYQEGIQSEKQKNYMQALASYTEAIKYDEKFAEAYEKRGDLYYRYKNYIFANADYFSAIKYAETENSNLYFKSAKSLFRIKKHEEGFIDLDKAIQLNPKNDSLYFFKGVNHSNLENYQEAINDYNKTLEINPGFFDARLGRALSNQSLTRYKESIEDFDILISTRPRDSTIYYYRGNSKFFLSDSSGACIDWLKSYTMNFKEAWPELKQYCFKEE